MLTLGFPLQLEVGLGIKEAVFVPFKQVEPAELFEDFPGPLVVFGMIGHEEEFAIVRETALHGFEELHLNQTPAMVLGLGPWIGAEQVKARDAFWGQ